MENLKAKMKQLVEADEYVEAMDVMAELATKKMIDTEIMYMGAYCYMMTGDNERSAKWVMNVLNRESNHVKARILLARLCIMEDRTEEALNIFEIIIKSYQKNLQEDDKEELEELLDYYRYSEADMLVEKYPNIAKFVGLEVPKKIDAEEQEKTAEDEAAARAKAAVAKLRSLLNARKKEQCEVQESVEVDGEAYCKQENAEETTCDTQNEVVENTFDVEGITAQIMAKPVSVRTKIKLFNSFAAGCYVNGDYQSAFDLLSGALALDSEDVTVLKNIAYVCAAAGEKEQAMEFASKLPMIEFGVLGLIRK